jgi:hypothetical protein
MKFETKGSGVLMKDYPLFRYVKTLLMFQKEFTVLAFKFMHEV